MERLIFHVDVNSAFLSWEAAKRVKMGLPDLRDIPSCIGGDPSKRTGIVVAKSIPAKKYGIQTGEPMAMAFRKCPNLVAVPSDFELYDKCSRAFKKICESYAPVMESFSIDEVFLDMTGTSYIYPDPVATAYELKDKMDDAANVFFKEPTLPDEVLQYREPVDPKELLAGLTLEKLNAIYKSIIRRQEDKVDPIRSKFGTIEKEEVSLSDKMIEIKDFARTHRKFSFRNLLESQCSKVQVIVTFLSILELMKMGHIHVEQDGLFDDISVEVQTDPDTWKNLTEFVEDEP